MLTDCEWKRSVAACTMPALFSPRNDRQGGTAYEIADANTANPDPPRHAFLMVCSMVERHAGESSRPLRGTQAGPRVPAAPGHGAGG